MQSHPTPVLSYIPVSYFVSDINNEAEVNQVKKEFSELFEQKTAETSQRLATLESEVKLCKRDFQKLPADTGCMKLGRAFRAAGVIALIVLSMLLVLPFIVLIAGTEGKISAIAKEYISIESPKKRRLEQKFQEIQKNINLLESPTKLTAIIKDRRLIKFSAEELSKSPNEISKRIDLLKSAKRIDVD